MEGHERENYPPEFGEPPVAFCSDPETNEKFLTLRDCPVGYSWLNLAKIEYKFELGTTAFQQALQISDRDAYPIKLFLSTLKHNMTLETKPLIICHNVYINWRMRVAQYRGITKAGKELEIWELILCLFLIHPISLLLRTSPLYW